MNTATCYYNETKSKWVYFIRLCDKQESYWHMVMVIVMIDRYANNHDTTEVTKTNCFSIIPIIISTGISKHFLFE